MVKRKKKTESRPHSEQHFKIHQHIGIKTPLQDFPCASKINRERKMYTCQFCTAKADHILSKLYLLNKQEAWRAVGTQWTSNFCQLHFFFKTRSVKVLDAQSRLRWVQWKWKTDRDLENWEVFHVQYTETLFKAIWIWIHQWCTYKVVFSKDTRNLWIK